MCDFIMKRALTNMEIERSFYFWNKAYCRGGPEESGKRQLGEWEAKNGYTKMTSKKALTNPIIPAVDREFNCDKLGKVQMTPPML